MCAVFNPQVQPTQDPNYLGYAKVVDAPAPDQSSALAISTSANLLEGSVHAIDTSIKKGIENEATKLIDPERDKMTAALEQTKKDTVTPAPVQTVSGSTTGSLLDANASMDAPEVPDGLQQGLDRISQLKDAQKAAKINDTQYSGNVLAIAKQLRAQYGGGYREYIDEQVSKISGLPVANAYYKNLMEDINRQLVQAQGQGNKIEGLYLKNLDVPNIQQFWAGYKSGQIPESTFIGKIADWQNLQTQYKIDASKRAEEKDNRDLAVKNTTSRFTTLASNEVNLGLQDVTTLGGGTSAAFLIKQIEDAAAGKNNLTSAELDQRRTQLAGITQAQGRALWVRAHTPGPDGSTVASIIGEDGVKAIINNVMIPMTASVEYAKDKDSSPIYLTARQNEAILNQDKNKFLINKDTGPAARQIQTVRSILGDQYFPTFMSNFMSTGADGPFKDLLTQNALDAIEPIKDIRGNSQPKVMKDAIQHGKSVGATSESGYVGSVVGLVSNLADPKMPLQAKDAMIRWAYDPKNIGRLDELKIDYRDPNTGEMVPGKYRAFNILSAPAITASVAETAKIHPENYVKYQGTLEREFASLFRTDIQNLNNVIEASKNDVKVVDGQTYKNPFEIHYSWNDKTNELGLVDKNNRPLNRDSQIFRDMSVRTPHSAGVVRGAFDILDRVNGGLKNLANVQEMNPQGAGDTTQYVFQALKDSNFRPGQLSGTTDAMKAMFKSRNPDATNEDIDKLLKKVKPSPVQPLDDAPNRSVSPPISRFAPEEDRSLGAFLRNPAGVNTTGLEPQQRRGVIKGNLSDSQLMDIQVDNIPDGMSARDFIRQLQSKR